MPLQVRVEFAGGCNDRPISTLEVNEFSDCRNVFSRDAVLQNAPIWEPVDNVSLTGNVIFGVGRADGSSVLVFNDYTYAILSAGETPTLSARRPLPGWTGTVEEGEEISGEWLKRGTVLVTSREGYWPVVILPDDTAQTLESLDVRTRRASALTMGLSEQGELFHKNEFPPVRTATRAAVEVTATRRYISIAATEIINKVVIEGTLPATTTAKLWFADEGMIDFDTRENTPDATATAVNNTLTLMADWEVAHGADVDTPFNGDTLAVVGEGQQRIVIELTAPDYDALSITKITGQHTEYLRAILGNRSPHLIAMHLNRLVLAFDDFIQIGLYGRFDGWEFEQERFQQGGDRIEALESHENFLAVFMRDAIYALTGNSYRNWGVDKLCDYSGTTEHRSVVSDLGYLFYDDGNNEPTILAGGGRDVRQVCRHVRQRLKNSRGDNGRPAAHVLANDLVLLMYHGQGDFICYLMDVEALREDRGGAWKVSTWPIDKPGATSVSWSLNDRRVMTVVGGALFRLNPDPEPDERAPATVTYPCVAGDDPTMRTVRRVTVRVSLDCDDDVVLSLVGGASITVPEDRVRALGGACRISLPPLLTPSQLRVSCGRRVLISVTIDYYSRAPGGAGG